MSDDVYEAGRMTKEGWKPYTLLRVPVQAAEPIYAGASATVIGHSKEIVAEFGVAGPEVSRLDENGDQVNDQYTGEPLKAVSIVGGVLDLQAQAEQKGWTPEEVEMVRAKLDYACRTEPDKVRRRSKARAAAPWATYDTIHHKKIPVLAEQLGLVAEALSYEKENKNRDEVVSKLEAALAGGRVEEALVAE